MVERIKSGIDGFDNLIAGGIPKNDILLLSGTCGTGKTVFCLEFLFSNARTEPGIFISFEEEIDKIRETAKEFGWKVDELEKEGKILFLKYDPFKIEDIFEIIESNIKEKNAKRIVIDSVSSLGLYVKDKTEVRRMLLQISNMLRKNNCTSILISEILPEINSLSRFGVEEFVVDDVVKMYRVMMGDVYKYGICVWKMRSTEHSNSIHPYKITKKGMRVYDKDIMVINK
ncbi:RAD55 family ATPase [Candidatus Aenigmatarchaeota archaeon]